MQEQEGKDRWKEAHQVQHKVMKLETKVGELQEQAMGEADRSEERRVGKEC